MGPLRQRQRILRPQAACTTKHAGWKSSKIGMAEHYTLHPTPYTYTTSNLEPFPLN